MIGIALLGAGYAARIQLACWKEIPGAAVIGVWNRSAERGRALAAEFGVPSFDELDPLQKFWTGRRETVSDDSFAPSAMIPASAWGDVLSQGNGLTSACERRRGVYPWIAMAGYGIT